MKVKIKARYGMTGLLMAGYGLKIFRRKRHLLIMTGRMRDSFKLDGGMLNERMNE